MSKQKPIEIANWEQNFEIAQSRRRAGRLTWVAMPTRHDSRGYRRLIRHESGNGVLYFACWCVLVQVSARCPVRGILADDRGLALTSYDFEVMTDIKAELFDDAIPILCDIGWVICPDSEQDTSVLGADSEQRTTTVHNSTVQTKQNITNTVNSSLLYEHRPVADANFKKIPEKHRQGLSKWRNAWVEVIVCEEIDGDMAMEYVLKFYQSDKAKGAYVRNPATLLHDHIWDEAVDTWNDGSEPAQDDTEVIERIFNKHEESWNTT